MLESKFQAGVIKDIYKRLPGCYVLKTDTSQIQGFPDLLILYQNKWAALEAKREHSSRHRPNQDYYIDEIGKHVFASFISPENREETLDDLQSALQTSRPARVSKRKQASLA